MNRKYNLKLDLQFRCNNSIMKFNQFDNNTSDFFIRITNSGNLVDIEKAIVVLAVIKPSGKVSSQFIEVKNGLVYVDLKPNMRDEIGTYAAKAMLILEDKKVVTDVISYEVEEDKIFSLLNDTVEDTEDFTLLTDMLSRLSTIEISEEQRVINEAERILSEENRKIEEAKRVEAELIRQHEEADRAKYDATRESNENIRKQNESIRLANETNRIDEEAKRVEQENKRKLAEEERNANYNFMTEDEERRRSEANAHKEAEKLRVQAETNRVNEEAKRRTTEQARVSAENTRVSNENTRGTNEVVRKNNETQRVEAETQRQNRYNSFILDAEANASNFENYTNTAKVKEEERKSNELDRKSQEDRRVSNEVERISNENTRKANEKAREKNETSRQNIFENKVDEVDKKIIELNTTKDNFVSSVNTKVDTKISELDKSKSDMTNTVTNKIDEVENRFNALTSKQQQDAEVIDARDGETSLKARLDRDIEKAKQVYVNIEGSHISTDSSVGYAKNIEILGNTVQDSENLADIRSVGDKVEGQELYEIPVLSRGKNLLSCGLEVGSISSNGLFESNTGRMRTKEYIQIKNTSNYVLSGHNCATYWVFYDINYAFISRVYRSAYNITNALIPNNAHFLKLVFVDITDTLINVQFEEGTQATPYEPYQEDKLTILSPTPLEKVGDVADRIISKDGVWGVEKMYQHNWDNISFTTPIGQFDGDDFTEKYNVFRLMKSQYNLIEKGIYPFSRLDGSFGENFKPYDGECVWGDNTYLYFKILKGKTTLDEFKAGKSFDFIILSDNPQFIPLPHDQQVKLRTFAGKTNISFLTEIEGTIKAQVPKSLGATVNTHTEQISNLNKELDRVKKLEESTVSTVTTESDFTTVEATSNGYFEDVKLEGKTLVNYISNFNNWSNMGNTTVSEDGASMTINATSWNKGRQISKSLPIGEYIFSINNPNNATIIVQNKTNAKTLLMGNNIDMNIKFSLLEVSEILITCKNTSETGTYVVNNPILTTDKNVNGYFEGLKSVGQSATTSEDGVDEIVVSSTTNEFTKDFEYMDLNTKHSYRANQTVNNLIRASLTNISNKIIKVELFNRSDYSYHSGIDINPNQTIELDLKDVYIKWISFDKNYWVDKYETTKYYAHLILNGKSDKKRLLYYNEETQTWEKPVLREWDSIEKHANGKYYYHQRSGEEDYTRGDESVSNYITDMTTTVKPLSQEKVYECTNIDLITYANETNYIVECGAISPKTTLKAHNNISNIVSLLQKKVSLLESNVKASQEVQDMMILETDMRMLDIELALMEFIPMTLNLGGSNMLRSATYFNFLKNHIINETYEKEYLENVMNKYLATERINQDEYDELYKMLYPPVYDIELPIEY